MTYYSALSWGVTIFLAGAAVYVYRPDLIAKALPKSESQNDQTLPASNSIGKKAKSKKIQAERAAAGDDSAASTNSNPTRGVKKRKISAPVSASVTATTTEGQQRELPRAEDSNVTDKEFAQQLAKAQAGTKLQSTSQPQATKTKKQKPISQFEDVSGSLTGASSTTGHDADEELSSADSPDRGPISGKDISDMLENPAAKPTSIRLTNISDEPKKAKPATQQFEQVLSKKKRNEQARREEQKRLREESDKIHEAKKQEQLRRARMAEGTSNQSRANAFNATTNAWQSGKSSTVKSPPPAASAPLLDTFEPSSSAQPAKGAVHTEELSDITNRTLPANSVNALKAAVGDSKAGAMAASSREGQNWADEMSEEVQIQKLKDQQQDDAWESVTNKKSKKKGKQETDANSEATTSFNKAANPAPTTYANGNGSNAADRKPESVNRFDSIQVNGSTGLQDDEWAA